MKEVAKNGAAASEAERVSTLMKADHRKPVALSGNGAVMSVIAQVLQQDAVKIALGSFCEGRELKGRWTLHILAAELVPIAEE